jgi:spermidine/putrescine-binding protein
MLKPFIAGAAALALMTGLAFAQEEQTTREKTTVEGENGRAVEAQKSERTTDAFGNQSTAQKSYEKAETPNGSEESRSREERTESPNGGSSSSRETTTTTKSPD